MELATYIAGRIAEQSYAPMDDLASLWATCLFMHRVCCTAEVDRHLPLRWVLQHQGFWEQHYYKMTVAPCSPLGWPTWAT